MSTPTEDKVVPPGPPGNERFMAYVSDIKEHRVANHKEIGTDDIQPCVRIVREGGSHGVEVLVWTPHISRDEALRVAEMMVAPMKADFIQFMADSHVTQTMENPNTGKPWGPNEMQNLCDNEGACAVGLLTDCLAFTTVWRDGRTRMESLLYHVDKENSQIHWQKEGDLGKVFDTSDPDAHAKGLVPEVLRESFVETEMVQMMHQLGDAMDVPVLEQEARTVCAMVGLLMQMGYICLIATDSAEAMEFYNTIHATYGGHAQYGEGDPYGEDVVKEAVQGAVSTAADAVEAELARRKAEASGDQG